MNLFTTLAPLVQSGAELTLKIQQNGAEMQVDVFVAGKNVPPRSFIASPQELDSDLPTILASYAGKAMTIADQAALTEAVMQKAVADGKKALANAATAKPAKPKGKPGATLDVEDEEDDDHPELTTTASDAGSDVQASAPVAASVGATPVVAPVSAANAAIEDLFV